MKNLNLKKSDRCLILTAAKSDKPGFAFFTLGFNLLDSTDKKRFPKKVQKLNNKEEIIYFNTPYYESIYVSVYITKLNKIYLRYNHYEDWREIDILPLLRKDFQYECEDCLYRMEYKLLGTCTKTYVKADELLPGKFINGTNTG